MIEIGFGVMALAMAVGTFFSHGSDSADNIGLRSAESDSDSEYPDVDGWFSELAADVNPAGSDIDIFAADKSSEGVSPLSVMFDCDGRDDVDTASDTTAAMRREPIVAEAVSVEGMPSASEEAEPALVVPSAACAALRHEKPLAFAAPRLFVPFKMSARPLGELRERFARFRASGESKAGMRDSPGGFSDWLFWRLVGGSLSLLAG